MESREQKLVDFAFDIVMSMAYSRDTALFDRDQLAGWVAGQLQKQGFITQRKGSSWGVLVPPEPMISCGSSHDHAEKAILGVLSKGLKPVERSADWYQGVGMCLEAVRSL
jgi:hypothetical protein